MAAFVFLPRELQCRKTNDTSDKWLLGRFTVLPDDPLIVYVLATTSDPIECEDYVTVGRIVRNEENVSQKIVHKIMNDVFVDLCDDGSRTATVRYKNETYPCIRVVFEPRELLASELLDEGRGRGRGRVENGSNNSVSKLLSVLVQWQQVIKSKDVTDLIGSRQRSRRRHDEITDECCRLSRWISFSSFAVQLVQRYRQLLWCFSLRPRHIISCLRCQNTLASVVLDVLISFLLFRHFLLWVDMTHSFELLFFSKQSVVDRVESLLQSLMGAPAGLKLNFPLNSALGHFFLAHIYLWKTYIILAKPVLRFMLDMIPLMGCLGITFQLTILMDLISLATFHIYCFYVYATRLYHLHVSGLISLWRLVRGRKRNPLRLRVDSCSYNVDQLFLGTLLFMVLLFLFPTTLVFYCVFCALRLVMLSAVGLLSRLVVFLSTFPSLAVLMHLTNSKLVASDVRFVVVERTVPSDQLILNLTVVGSSLNKIWNESKPLNFIERDNVGWGEFLQDLVIGNLIYPL